MPGLKLCPEPSSGRIQAWLSDKTDSGCLQLALPKSSCTGRDQSEQDQR